MSGVSGPVALQPELYLQLVAALKDAYATRYLSAAGLVVLLYDHILTFSEEIRLVWHAPHSFAKYAFLFNRYLVLSCLLPVAHEMSGLKHNAFTTAG
ncbi:hypothetical protein QCA50_011689 [Cerrena zonata]|uniref:DUF6533 domain-containing protein n=1 Tax=Cerrena zonata TaxID=2478898 RepID=A0AAW0G2G9_9APHY